jgi:selenocysteine lyase/cysteine desulfurase
VRVSPHSYNSMEDIEILLERLERHRELLAT